MVLYQIQETNQLQLSSSEIHITRQLLNHSFHYYNGFRLSIIGVLNGIDDSIGGLSSGIRGLGSGMGGLGGGNWRLGSSIGGHTGIGDYGTLVYFRVA